jgi:hypothetical protein
MPLQWPRTLRSSRLFFEIVNPSALVLSLHVEHIKEPRRLVKTQRDRPPPEKFMPWASSAGATSLPTRSPSSFRVGSLRVVCANASSAIALVHGATGRRACYAPRWTIKWRSECHNDHQCALGNKQVLMQSSHISIAVQAKPCQHH